MSEPTALESELLDLAEGKRIPTQASMIETLALVLSLAVDADDGISRARAFEVMEVAVRLAELDFRLLSSGAPGCRAVPDVEDNAIDASGARRRTVCRQGRTRRGAPRCRPWRPAGSWGSTRAVTTTTSGRAHLRKPYTVARRRDEVTDWAAEAIARAPLLLGLCASASADDRGAFRVRNGTKPPQTPITDTQEGAIEVFLEEGPAAMVALVAERAEIKAALDAADLSLGASEPKNQAASLAQRVRWLAEARDVCVPAVLDSDLADEALRAAKVPGQPMAPNIAERVGTVIAERDELRLEILALRGDKAGAVSDRWKWSAPCWRIRGADGALLAKVATTNLLAWTRNGDIETGGIEQATSIRDGMRRCEARLAGGAS